MFNFVAPNRVVSVFPTGGADGHEGLAARMVEW